MMKYCLMHKNIPVLDFILDDVTCSILKIGEIHRIEHLPVGLPVTKGHPDRASLNEWWKGRAIPLSRQGIRQALQELEVSSPQNLLNKCFGLSLSDQYWIRPADQPLSWSEINFFTNSFSDDVGNILFGKSSSDKQLSLLSPDNTSDGWLKKKWCIMDGKRCLIKGGSGALWQEPYNEVFASILMKRLGIEHVSYTLSMQDGYPYSVCEDFITPQTELVSAWYIMQTYKKENHVSVYQHYVECCRRLDIPDVVPALDRMLVADYLLVNEDRHQNNFGAVRNAETLEWIGTAPLFDSGTSLYFQTPISMISPKASRNTCKPFKTSHEEQIRLVTDFDWIDWDALKGIELQFAELVADSPFIDAARCDAICHAIRKRVEMLQKIALMGKGREFAVSCANDVRQDQAYSGNEQ